MRTRGNQFSPPRRGEHRVGAIVRRAIISLGVAVALFLAVPLAVPATQVGVARVAILSDQFLMGPLTPSWLEAFRGGLNDLGWSEGRNLTIDIRAVENPEQRPRIVADLLHRNPSVIVTTPPGARIIAPHVRDPKLPGWTPVTSIPIVFAWYSDPVGAGLVTSLARPGGNVTGLAYLGIELNAKRLELLKEAFPTLKRVGVLVPVDHPLEKRMVAEVEAAARTLKIEPRFAGARLSDPSVKIDEAIESLARERVEAILGLQGPHYGRERQRIAELTLKHPPRNLRDRRVRRGRLPHGLCAKHHGYVTAGSRIHR